IPCLLSRGMAMAQRRCSTIGISYLASELRSLEEELLLTRYELQAYREILEKLPQEKQKITCLHKNASEKIYRLNGKIRAVSQLVMM
ncbi:hypothetical protein ACK35C_20430, partial [Aeromonas veronii]